MQLEIQLKCQVYIFRRLRQGLEQKFYFQNSSDRQLTPDPIRGVRRFRIRKRTLAAEIARDCSAEGLSPQPDTRRWHAKKLMASFTSVTSRTICTQITVESEMNSFARSSPSPHRSPTRHVPAITRRCLISSTTASAFSCPA